MGELPFKEERSTYFFPQHTLLVNTLIKYCRLGVGQGACPLRKEKDQHVHPSLVGLHQATGGSTLVALSEQPDCQGLQNVIPNTQHKDCVTGCLIHRPGTLKISNNLRPLRD